MQNIITYLPALLELTTLDPDFPWDRIDRDFSALLNTKNNALSVNSKIEVEATLFFTIISARKGHLQAIGMLHFLNCLFEELSDHLEAEEKKMICSNIKNVLTTFNIQFYNFIGEVATLNNLMKTNNYRLHRIETPLPNGSSIDFQLHQSDNNKLMLVEILNIHLDSDRIVDNPTAIEKFLTYRASEKIKKKNDGLEKGINFYLIMVLWGGWKDIEVYSRHFTTNKLTLDNVIEPLAYLQHSDGKGYYKHQFGRVSTLVF